jgi:hypothetical protein
VRSYLSEDRCQGSASNKRCWFREKNCDVCKNSRQSAESLEKDFKDRFLEIVANSGKARQECLDLFVGEKVHVDERKPLRSNLERFEKRKILFCEAVISRKDDGEATIVEKVTTLN